MELSAIVAIYLVLGFFLGLWAVSGPEYKRSATDIMVFLAITVFWVPIVVVAFAVEGIFSAIDFVRRLRGLH